MKYKATFSARKQRAIGSFYSVSVEFESAESYLELASPGTRSALFNPAWEALNAAGYECHHLLKIEEATT
jgi:hypothetical protein